MSLLNRIIIFCTNLLVLAVLSSILVGEAHAQVKKKCGPYDSGNESFVLKPTKDELERILSDHAIWLRTYSGNTQSPAALKDKRRANLCRASLIDADLHGVNLQEADLLMADLFRANLTGANLSGAILNGANLRAANLQNANLQGAIAPESSFWQANMIATNLRGALFTESDLNNTKLRGADLREADLHTVKMMWSDLSEADLSKANLTDADLKGTDLTDAKLYMTNLFRTDLNDVQMLRTNVSYALFEPKPLDDVTGLLGIRNLSTIKLNRVNAVVALRKKVKEAGFKTEEKALTSALRKHYSSKAPRLEQLTWFILLGGFLTDFGAKPFGALGALLTFVFVFVWPYLFAIKNAQDASGIWRIRPENRILKEANEQDHELIHWCGLARSFAVALYFSLLSAFHFGWRDLNIANWVVRVQKREYVLRATGWVRTVSGVQSLISLYLVVLWLLAYFGDLYA